MCVIVAIPKDGGTIPLMYEFKSMERTNPDGAGIAWIDKKTGLVRWEKGLSADGIFKLAMVLPTPLLIHFRFATHGGKTLALNHPFPVNKFVQTDLKGSAKTVLTHNGVWHEHERVVKAIEHRLKIKKPSGDWSDTRSIAFMASIIGKNCLDLIGEKVCTLSVKNGLEFFGNGWAKERGNIYSNLYWKPTVITTPTRDDYWRMNKKNKSIPLGKDEIANNIRSWHENKKAEQEVRQAMFDYGYSDISYQDDNGDIPPFNPFVTHSDD